MSLRLNALILGTVVAGTFAVGMAGAESTTPIVNTTGKSDRVISGALTVADGTLTVEYRGENLSFLARVPLAP
ncbi:MAG: hypothetical protein KIT43_11925 [Bauldia sp.]|nr:hypothetical protein [Bauldia sp.]